MTILSRLLRSRPATSLVSTALLFEVIAAAETRQHPFIDCSPRALAASVIAPGTGAIEAGTARLFRDRVPDLLKMTLVAEIPDIKLAENEYVVIHVLHWKDLASNAEGQEVDAQNWYVYSPAEGWTEEEFSDDKHLLGVDHIYLLYVHLNKDAGVRYSSDYSITVTSKLPTNLNNLFNLLGAYTSIPSPKAGLEEAMAPNAIWGVKRLDVDFKTSDIDITPQFNVMKGEGCVNPTGVQAKNIQAIKLDNEGKSFFDFSVAVPITKISQLTFNADQNVVTPTQVDTSNVFALVDFYLPKVDLKHRTFNWIPHPLAGVAFAAQPLHKVLVGLGIGPQFAEFYVGALFVKEQGVAGTSCGSSQNTTTPSQVESRFCPQFSYGVNIPVSGLTAALKKTTK